MDRISPAERPPGRPAGSQRWRHLLFLHWEVSPEALRPLLPEALSIDTFEGRAYVGVVPFTMRDVRPRWSPSVPGISNFHELNVRTYVHHEGSRPGVWFFSLDAAKLIAVVAARVGWGLPYHFARMALEVQGDEVRYRSRRLAAGSTPADFEARYRIGARARADAPIEAAAPGMFEHFLAERYILYARSRDGSLRLGRVHHRPYPLQRAEVLEVRQSMVQAAGLPALGDEAAPHALYSPGVDVEVYPLDAVR